MSPEQITNLLINVGLAGSLVVFFVLEGRKREQATTARMTALEEFQKQELLELVKSSQAVLVQAAEALTQSTQTIEEAMRLIGRRKD